MPEKASNQLYYLKFLCIVMIIGLHTVFTEYFAPLSPALVTLNRFVRTIYDSGISAFFFFSAYLFFRKPRGGYLAVVLSKAKGLLVPYLFWNALMLLYTFVRQSLTVGHIPAWSLSFLLKSVTVTPINSVLWFVLTLMGFVLLYPLVAWVAGRAWRVLLVMIVCNVLYYLPQLPVPYETILHWTPVYVLGAYIGAKRTEWMENAPLWRSPLLRACCAAALLGLALIRLYWDGVQYLAWQATPFLLWGLTGGLGSLPKAPWWIKASFTLYCSHMLFEHYAVKLYTLALGAGPVSYVAAHALLPVFCAFLTLIGAAVFRRLLPRLYRLATGERA